MALKGRKRDLSGEVGVVGFGFAWGVFGFGCLR